MTSSDQSFCKLGPFCDLVVAVVPAPDILFALTISFFVFFVIFLDSPLTFEYE